MNADEISALVTKLVLLAFSAGAGASVATQNQAIAIATGVGAIAAVVYGVWQHWNMRKVPEKAIVRGEATTVAGAIAASAPSVGGPRI